MCMKGRTYCDIFWLPAFSRTDKTLTTKFLCYKTSNSDDSLKKRLSIKDAKTFKFKVQM